MRDTALEMYGRIFLDIYLGEFFTNPEVQSGYGDNKYTVEFVKVLLDKDTVGTVVTARSEATVEVVLWSTGATCYLIADILIHRLIELGINPDEVAVDWNDESCSGDIKAKLIARMRKWVSDATGIAAAV